MKNAVLAAISLAFLTLAPGCNQDPASAPNPSTDTAYIRILEPKPGAKIRLDERFKIITESDYDKFGQKLSYAASTDSGRSWQAFIVSLEPRTGMDVRDTVTCSFDSLGFAAGQKTRIRVIEYGKAYSATTDFIDILP